MKKKISITIDTDLYEWAKQFADNERISISSLFNRCILYKRLEENNTPHPKNTLRSS